MAEFWEEITAITNKQAAKLEKAFISYVDESKGLTDWKEVEDLLGKGEEPADHLVWAEYKPEGLIKETFAQVAMVQGDHIVQVAKVGYRFDMKNPEALKWIKAYGADEVKYISDSSKKAIKEINFRGYYEGYTPKQQAQFIKGLVGLDPNRAQAVENYFAELLKDESLSLEEIVAKRDDYAKQLLQQRAMTIAVNEASEASAQGNYITTKDAVSRGILDPDTYEAYRIVTPDDRICPICSDADHDGETRELPDGVYETTGSHTPKIHILCRCVEGITPKKSQNSGLMIKRAPLCDGVAGRSTDGQTIYIDPIVPDSEISAYVTHEVEEHRQIQAGLSYSAAHIKGDEAERTYVEAHGGNWPDHQARYHKLLKQIEARNPPPEDPPDMFYGDKMKQTNSGDPFAGLSKPLTPEDLIRAIRLAMVEEQRAIVQYTAYADATDNADAKTVLQSIADEERQHVGEFQALLGKLAPDEGGLLAEGAKETNAGWDGAAAAKGLLDHAEKDSKIQKSLIADYFGVIDGDGANRTDYHYPIGKMEGGKPAYDASGLIAGFVAASGSHGAPPKPALQKRFAGIMKKEFPDKLTDGMKEVLGMKSKNEGCPVKQLISEALAPLRDKLDGVAKSLNQAEITRHVAGTGMGGQFGEEHHAKALAEFTASPEIGKHYNAQMADIRQKVTNGQLGFEDAASQEYDVKDGYRKALNSHLANCNGP